MSGNGHIVPPMSWAKIEQVTNDLRSQFGLVDEPYFPIMNFLEHFMDRHGFFRLEVGSHAEMRDDEGRACPRGEFIELREDVYEKAWDGDGRARFTVAHELGHWCLHSNVVLPRAKHEVEIPHFRLSEPQANQFAAGLLMPDFIFGPEDMEQVVMRRHGVSYEAAKTRLRYLRGKGKI